MSQQAAEMAASWMNRVSSRRMDVSRLLISEPAPDSPTTRPNKVPRMENNGGPFSPATTGFGGEQIERKPNHFGDILAPREITTVLPAGFTGLERIVLSANGNLQRLMSAYYNSPVSVEIIKNDRVGQTSIFEREVNLTCFGKAFCNAKSTVTIKKEEHLRLVLEEKVGIGQLFFHLRLLPSFVLLQAGRSGGVSLWREYRLEADSIVCEIREEFVADLFDLRPEYAE